MLKITKAAWQVLSDIQTARPGLLAMRLTEVDGRIKCQRGVEEANDRVIHQDGCPTLLLAPVVAKKLNNRLLDAAKTSAGRKLRLKQVIQR